MSATKKGIKIEYFDGPFSNNVEATFTDMKSFRKWVDCESKNRTLYADRVSINGLIILGWDEIGM